MTPTLLSRPLRRRSPLVTALLVAAIALLCNALLSGVAYLIFERYYATK